MAKKVDPKAKAKRQKMIAAAGGVLLLGLLAFQIPRTLKMLHPQAGSAATTTTSASAGTATGPIAAPSLGGGNATPAAASVSADGLSDPGSLPTAQSGQLLAFSRFRTKDPFSQQLSLSCAGGSDSAGGATAGGCSASGSSSGSSSGSRSSTSGKAPAKKPPSAGVVLTPVSRKTSPAPAAKPTTATISVNGETQRVQVGAQFPASSPTFTLVALTATSARIGIAGGSFQSGGATVTLKKNKPLTLMNTADGTRYVLRLLSVS